jgi:hypothetical protein
MRPIIIFGAALIHALMTAPRGIAGQLADLFVSHLTASEGSSAMIAIRDITVTFGGVVALNKVTVDLTDQRSSASSGRTAPARRRC